MNNLLQLRKIMRTLVFSAASAIAACTLTACDKEAEDALGPQDTGQEVSENGAVIPGQYIVVFKDASTLRLRATTTYAQRIEAVRTKGHEFLEANGVENARITQAYGKAILGVAAELSEQQVERLKADERIAYIEPDRMFVLKKPGSVGGGTPSGETLPWGIARVGYKTGTGMTAWVIDTGIDLSHPDLNVDEARSRTFVTRGKDAQDANDGNGHGTHVAGTIAAIKNTIGVVGVASGATVVAVKVLNAQGSGAYSDVIAGIDYVASAGKSGEVANMSLGGSASQAIDDAVLKAAQKGIKFALAAGNESANANNSSPARVEHPNVYTVSAMDNKDTFASFSNYGNPPIDYCAPGVSILSTWKNGGYNTISGTSMATPHVAGLLLVGIASDGTVTGDRDTKPDPIAVLKTK